MARELPKLQHSSFDDSFGDIFSTEAERQEAKQEKIHNISFREIDNFKNHPYHIKDDTAMEELTESVRNNGIIMPCIVRPRPDGRFEMISGHRRKHAALKAGIEELPCIVRDMDDNEAVLLMVDSNAHRPVILPSEKAFAYKMKLEAMNQQGKRTDLTYSPVGNKLKGVKSSDIMAQDVGESKNTIFRYIRLTNLLPEILQMVDNAIEKPQEGLQMALRPAVELSYLTLENQQTVLAYMNDAEITPSLAQAIELRKMQTNGTLSTESVFSLLSAEKPNQKEKVTLSVGKFSRYFPKDTPVSEIEKGIFEALDFYQKAQEKARQRTENRAQINL